MTTPRIPDRALDEFAAALVPIIRAAARDAVAEAAAEVGP